MGSKCNVKDCEKYADKVYCPSRFTFDEMVHIEMALQLAPGYLYSFMEYVRENNNYDALEDNEKIMFDNGMDVIAKMEKLEKKIDRLLRSAIEN